MKNSIQKGFTVLELLISIAIIVLLSTFAVQGLAKFKLNQAQNNEVTKVLAVLNEARVRAQSGDSARNYSVTINTAAKTMTLFRVTTDPGDTAYSSVSNLNPQTTLSLLMNSGNTITFERFTGATTNTGTITVSTTSGTNTKSSTIRIYKTGLAALE